MLRLELSSLVAQAPPALCQILASQRGPTQAVIRSEIFGPQRFAQHGRSLALTHRAANTSRVANFFPRIKDNILVLREAHHYIGGQASTGYDISPAAEWLLDNFHLIEAQLKEINEGLPRSFFRKLPMLQDEPLAGLPRVYGVAWAFVAHTDGAFDESLLVHYLLAYQEVRELNLNEMWALPTTLRVVLIENLRRLAERVATNKAAREAANLCFDRIEGYSAETLDQLLALLNTRGLGDVFLVQMALRQQDLRISLPAGEPSVVQLWLQRVLPDVASLQARQGTEQASDNLSMSNAITSLRAIGDADWPDIIARTSSLMQLMLESPVFAAEDTLTRDHSLHAIERLSRRSQQTELTVARLLLEQMKHADPDDPNQQVPEHWLSGSGRPQMLQALDLNPSAARTWLLISRHLAFPLYLFTLALTLGLLLWLLLRQAASPGNPVGLLLIALAMFPASEAVVAVINRLISESAAPQHLPRFALVEGIPVEQRVLVVIPCMLYSAQATSELVHQLHLHYLANPEPQAQFALLSDWADAPTSQTASDAAELDGAIAQIQALNTQHPVDAGELGGAPRFILLHRSRQFSQTEQRWIGWERKRGKLELLIAALASAQHGAFLDLAAASQLAPGVQYVLTLDSDTQLPPGRLRELVGVAAHPRNQPRLDASARRVVAGYAILQPRVATPLPAIKEFTLYHWLFAGQCGIDPYSAASSEVYQDLFDQGTFTGKGLLHVQAMHAVLAERLPQDQVLSHDLIEGAMARCAAVSDLCVIEDAPFHADVAASRVHRWTRGDWQLLPFMLQPRRFGLDALNLWKMLDNLRRSLVAPMSLALLLLTLSGVALSPWTVLALVLAAFSAGPLMGALAGFSPSRDDIAKRHFYREAGIDLARALWGGLWLLAQLLQQALQNLDAITRALYRMLLSRRHLLQWTTAAAAQRQAKSELLAVARQHWKEPLIALLLLGGLLAADTPSPALAVSLCLLWGAAPLWTWWVSRTCPVSPDAQLPQSEQDYLAGIARDTWRLFERCVSEADLHLPPDNLQLTPHELLAHRTSPTNIGIYLLSVACAREFGWIGTQDLLSRLEATLATLQKLERYRGHFLNWYDTQNGTPLLPMYVSTVDSGNLSAHLLAVAQACLELAQQAPDGAACARALAASRKRLTPLLAQRSHLSAAQREELRCLLADHRATLRSAQLDQAADTQHAALATPEHPSDSVLRLQALAQALTELAWQADFKFLYSSKRHLFHIGYRVTERQRDAGFYDLLASESRLASLLGIARGDVPVRHWASLGRPFFAVSSRAGLRSWTGSMFEYLMPGLVLHEPYGSVLHDACHAALHEQWAFARLQGVPWGISESAYAASDYTLAYQYAPQGVPRLALRRTPPDELVIAPYATALAAQLAPHRAVQNFNALQALGARARYGFMEALDFTAARRTDGQAFTPVNTFMAHHQGMSIVALTNVLLGGAAQRWGMANAHLQAVSSLLHERVPREVSQLYAPPAALEPQTQRRHSPGLLREVLPGGKAVAPTHILSNGHYSVLLRANGAGSSSLGQSGITRTRDDALRDDRGSFFYLRRGAQARAYSITQHPAPDPAAHYSSVFHADRVCFDTDWPELQAHTTVWVSPEDDIEFRQVELRNLSDQPLELELISAFEATLSEPLADQAHPAFMNLFLSAQWLASHQAILMARKPRLATEQGLKMAHFLTYTNAHIVNLCLATDRQCWLGRNRDASQPLASFDCQPDEHSSTLDTGLDPVCALSLTLRLGPAAKARVTFATAACPSTDTLRAVIDKYRQTSNVARASLMSTTLTGIRLRALRINAENFAAMQTLTTALTSSLTRVQARAVRPGSAASEVCDRRLLWRFGISGDHPMLLVLAGVTQGLGLLRSLAPALNLWLWGNVACDLVVINAEPASYLMPLDQEISQLRDRHVADCNGKAGGHNTRFHLLRASELSNNELHTLHSLARVVLHADGRPLTHHVQAWAQLHEVALERRLETSGITLTLPSTQSKAPDTSTGAFTSDGSAFDFEVHSRLRPKRPWINVLANPSFGAQLSEAGGGYTWAINSRLNQLTAWSNDPVGDPPSEWFLLQNLKTRELWSLAPSAGVDERLTYRIRHGQGFSSISHRRGDLEVNAVWCVDAKTAIKQIRVSLINHGRKTLHLRLIGMVEWLMGANRSDRNTVRTAFLRTGDSPSQASSQFALLCTQRERAAGFGNGTAFLSLSQASLEQDDWTCDRRECFDARGRLVIPDFFGQTSGDGLDPCAALSTRLTLGPDQSAQLTFLLGYAEHPDQVAALLLQAAQQSASARQDQVQASWQRLLGATTVKTPDPLFDALVNHWLLYQTLSCRMWAKAGFYQAGGATGFRDQLQDAMALAWTAPQMLREQIVLNASRQFLPGDVQHWWHQPQGNGVRSHFSDDLLWLAHACAHYLRATGDGTVLDEPVAFLEGPAIAAGAEDAYFTPSISTQLSTVYEHAARAIDRSLAVGAHGLPLMGSGDWNDGMNRVGNEGRGESVWLGWFLCQVLADFIPVAQQRGEAARAARWQRAALDLKDALVNQAWDGQWFKRAYFDDGTPLGSKDNTECRIDLIAQAWSVLSKVAPLDLQHLAMAAVQTHLIDSDAGLIKLLEPPLAKAVPSAGYIQAYPPGVRENAGQYSHAGVWALMAQAELASTAPDPAEVGDLVYRYFNYLSPAHRASNAAQASAYGLEPYVMAGDVYTQPPYVGRGGWSWYTGAAAWMHRAAIESIFGLHQRAQELEFNPCLPRHWTQVELTLLRDERSLHFILLRCEPAALALAAVKWHATVLQPGQPLRWLDLPAKSSFVIPLQPDDTPKPPAPAGH